MALQIVLLSTHSLNFLYAVSGRVGWKARSELICII